MSELPARAEQILEAALTVFDAAGFDAARVEDIAIAAGVSKGAVYLHFESKQALLQALIARHVSPVAQQAAAMAEVGLADPAGTLRRIMTVLPTRIDDSRFFAVPRLVISVSNRFPEIAALYRVEVFERIRGALIALIEAGIVQGRFRRVDPAVVVRALMGAVIVEAMRRHVFRDPDASAAHAVEQLEFILSTIETEAGA